MKLKYHIAKHHDIDHVNGNPLDNGYSNLKIVHRSKNRSKNKQSKSNKKNHFLKNKK
jgi:hypothetical protein